MPVTLTADKAQEFLRGRGHDARDLVPLTGGEWSTAFAFREGERDLVVRFHERRDDLEKDRFVQRWVTAGLRTPRIVEIGDLPEGGYGISERVSGMPIDDLDDDGMRAALPGLLAALDAMREADLSGTRGYGGWHADGNGERDSWCEALLGSTSSLPLQTMTGRRERMARSPIGADAFDAGLARLRDLVRFCPEDRQLVHSDLLNRNVLADGPDVTILDWGSSNYGDHLYDAAWLTFWWPWYTRWSAIDIRSEVERHHRAVGLTVTDRAERMRCYELEIGLGGMAYQAWRERWTDCAWTARRTAELAAAPL